MSEGMKNRIKRQEGLRLKVYDDATGKPIVPGSVVKGHPTIAYGRALDVNGVSREEADEMFEADYLLAEIRCQKLLPGFKALSEPRRFVMLSMMYQMGPLGLAGFRKMLQAVEYGDWAQAAIEMLSSQWYLQTPERASELAQIMKHGVYPDGSTGEESVSPA